VKYKKLRSLMIIHGLKQEDMANILRIDKSSFNLKINGRRAFVKPEIDEIIKLFGQTYEEIFFDDEIHTLGIEAVQAVGE